VYYSELVSSAGFESRVATIREALERLSPEYLEMVDAEDGGIVERAQLLLDHVLVVTSSADPRLLPKTWVGDLIADLDSLHEAVEGLAVVETVTSPAVQALSSAADAVAHELVAWTPVPSGDWREAVSEAASTYRRSAGQQMASLRSDIEAATQRVVEVKDEVEQLAAGNRQASDARLETLKEEVAELTRAVSALDTQRSAIEQQVSRAAERADQVIAGLQEQFTAAQESRSTEFQRELRQISDTAKSARDKATAEADQGLAKIHAKVAEAGDLVAVFAAAGTANFYSREANQQAKLADRWRLAAIFLALCAGLSALALLFTNGDRDTNWSQIIGKLLLAVALGGLASYSAAQSARHRGREERARHLELNIETTGPLLHGVDEEKATEARLRVVEAMLNGHESERDTRTQAITDAQINMIGRLFEALQKVGAK
jgi:hypothetical protein